MTELSGAFDFRKTTTRVFQGYPSVTATTALTVPTYAGTWTVVTQIDVVCRDTGTGAPAFFIQLGGSGFTPTAFMSGGTSGGSYAHFRWDGEITLTPALGLEFNVVLGGPWDILIAGFFQPSEQTT